MGNRQVNWVGLAFVTGVIAVTVMFGVFTFGLKKESERAPAAVAAPAVEELQELGRNVFVFTDPLNGCQYLNRVSMLTPRMDTEGKQICGTLVVAPVLKGGAE